MAGRAGCWTGRAPGCSGPRATKTAEPGSGWCSGWWSFAGRMKAAGVGWRRKAGSAERAVAVVVVVLALAAGGCWLAAAAPAVAG